MTKRTIKIGGACGFWGESDMALAQFLEKSKLDYVVFDYLAEVTLSIMARARAKDPNKGYAIDFVDRVLKPNLVEVARQGVKIVSNAGGMNPRACVVAIERLIKDQNLDLKVALVTGDDLLDQAESFALGGFKDMYSGDAFPQQRSVASINAYLGAGPIAKALELGADIVITGRCVDSALTLGPCISAFGWQLDNWDLLAAGSLAGHLIECGPQATGGNFTDWETVVDTLGDVGYPIVEIDQNGSITLSKPVGTGGAVTVGTVGEQLLYEVGDPGAYVLPDVVCDFRGVKFSQIDLDRVEISGVLGRPAPPCLKVSATYNDGWRAGTTFFFVGDQAPRRARAFGKLAIERARKKLQFLALPDFTETLIEIIGDGSSFGPNRENPFATDVAVKIACKHQNAQTSGVLLKEAVGLALAAPPGLSNFAGNPAKPSPVVRLFSFLLPRELVEPAISIDGEVTKVPFDLNAEPVNSLAGFGPEITLVEPETEFLLRDLAWARSGDKGDKANIGVLPRDEIFGEWIWRALSEENLKTVYGHYLDGEIERYFMPGTGGMNIVLNKVLGGGGVASLRNDPQGKTYAQLLLNTTIPLPAAVASFVASAN